MWGKPKCPIDPEAAQWVEASLGWLGAEFGANRLHGPVILPTDEFFPGAYAGTESDVRQVFGMLCAHMGVDPARVDFVYEAADPAEQELLASLPAFGQRFAGAAGEYVRRNGRGVISVSAAQAADPMALVATIAHELGHERLIGEGRIGVRADEEQLTDLLTVYFGLGIFNANAAFRYTGHAGGWRTSSLGYLSERTFGYALAVYAQLRGERKPAWARHVDPNPRAYLTKGLRYRWAAAERESL
ncbi:hypothetical protein Cme02nite_69960 [Catellatospora methionotrophica]|uniref:Uncharacterized protein n=1 Tax=Catellatospora methionotrophica TaxID=121620 RepID=A0A8J3PJD5_9ACTN|nr:hypothetical protein [Catellatospora methionotrophica]GIG18664.1 hypothetical protein Cme02nite_69960 [Catellatospora methionotrophica]